MPEISRWRMHPFSVADCSGSLLTLHVKRYGAFTKVGRPLAVRCSVHESSRVPLSHSAVLAVLGPQQQHPAQQQLLSCQLPVVATGGMPPKTFLVRMCPPIPAEPA